jgi:multidrug resistance efflux pump
MSTEVLPERQGSSDAGSGFSRPVVPRNRDLSSQGRWWRRGLLAVGLIVILASVSALIPRTMSAGDTDPQLTHTITRGNLLVTVTEQGTLESSNNTEIKCEVRGFNTVTWVIPGGTVVEPGDELVRLDTKAIEEQVSLTKTNTHIAEATLARSKANVETAEIAGRAYTGDEEWNEEWNDEWDDALDEEGQGVFWSEWQGKQQELEVAKRNLRVAEKMLQRSKKLFKQGYATDLEVQGNAFTVKQATLELKIKETEIDVLERLTRKKRLVTLEGNLTASKSKQSADEAGLDMEQRRKQRAEEELADCVINAERSGLVIYPSAAAWKRTPDITEGATVRKDQVLLLMPDLTQMQVKVGIHESVVDRVKPGLPARVTLPDRTLEAEVSSVASVTKPAGWWTGNVVKYDTIIKLPSVEGLKPGMSAEVEVVLARHENVLTLPVAAVVETEEGDFCWVKTAEGPQRRSLQLADSNDVFIVVEAGLKEGDEVVLNPIALIDEAEKDALTTNEETGPRDSDAGGAKAGLQSPEPGS